MYARPEDYLREKEAKRRAEEAKRSAKDASRGSFVGIMTGTPDCAYGYAVVRPAEASRVCFALPIDSPSYSVGLMPGSYGVPVPVPVPVARPAPHVHVHVPVPVPVPFPVARPAPHVPESPSGIITGVSRVHLHDGSSLQSSNSTQRKCGVRSCTISHPSHYCNVCGEWDVTHQEYDCPLYKKRMY